MDVYVEAAHSVLKDILHGKLKYEERLAAIKADIRSKLDRAERLVICGMSPVGRIAERGLAACGKPIETLDLREAPSTETIEHVTRTEVHRGGTLYAICSREDAARYLELVPETNADVLSYNELFLLDASFDYPESAFHNHAYCCQRLEDVFLHAAEYLEMLDALSDCWSRSLLARLILYRYTWDLSLSRGIKSAGMHYFKDVMELGEQESFVDAGGFDGDTLRDFLQVTGGNFASYVYLEPEEQAFHKVKGAYGTDARISFYQQGLSDEAGTLHFDTSGGGDQGRVSAQGSQVIHMTTLDALDIKPTLIKMDIEGAECAALDGAENTIRKYLPKLAICIYHKPNDLVEVYRRLLNYGYHKFYIRAEADSLDYEMVMYALASGGQSS